MHKPLQSKLPEQKKQELDITYVPFQPASVTPAFLRQEFSALQEVVSFAGAKKIKVSAPDGITIKIEPLEGMLQADFNHADTMGSGALICSYNTEYIKIKLRSTGRHYTIYRGQ